MRFGSVLILSSVLVTSFMFVQASPGQAADTSAWKLPQHLTVRDSGPRTYRFTVDYNIANTKGEIVQRQRFSGDYTRGLANGEVSWKNVAQAQSDGATAPFGAAQKREFMEGFRYRNDLPSTLAPDFFKGFPPTAAYERNLVWDTGMMEYFGQSFFENLRLNEPFHAGSDETIKMPGIGTFQNRDVVLEWIGRSRRNGQDCAIIKYQAFLNPVDIATGGMAMQARSEYWGDIWVSLETKQIEYGTINEEVTGELKLPGQDMAQNLSVFRAGTFELLGSK